MNGLEITVVIILAACMLAGYYRGFLRVLYSLLAWIFVLAFVTLATPYVAGFLESSTGMKQAIEEKCVDYMTRAAENAIADGAEEYGNGQARGLEDSDLFLPDSVIKKIAGDGAAVIGGVLEGSGVYEEIAGRIASYIIEGISFFVTMAAAGIFTFWISHLLNIISRIPVLQGPNKVFGAAAGGCKGLVATWLLFYVIDLCAARELGKQLHLYIEESPFLSVLYQHNILFQIIQIFL